MYKSMCWSSMPYMWKILIGGATDREFKTKQL